MEIKKGEYYSIVKFDEKGKIIDYFNCRVYLDRFVKLAYNQIPNKEEYTICAVKSKALKESN